MLFNEESFAEEFQIVSQVIIMKCSLHISPSYTRKTIMKAYWEKSRILEKTHNNDKNILMPREEIVKYNLHGHSKYVKNWQQI